MQFLKITRRAQGSSFTETFLVDGVVEWETGWIENGAMPDGVTHVIERLIPIELAKANARARRAKE